MGKLELKTVQKLDENEDIKVLLYPIEKGML